MTVWTFIRASLGETSCVVTCLERAWDALVNLGREPKGVAFTVALVALSAKMAKADGIVTDDEVSAFRRVIEIPPGEERNVARLFNLAQVDTAGFETYAARIVAIVEGDAIFLASVLDALFHIAAADGVIHEAELLFLERVATVFGIAAEAFDRVVARFARPPRSDPYRLLGVSPEASSEDIRRRWRALAFSTHPDRHHADPAGSGRLAELSQQLAAINSAWDAIRAERGLI